MSTTALARGEKLELTESFAQLRFPISHGRAHAKMLPFEVYFGTQTRRSPVVEAGNLKRLQACAIYGLNIIQHSTVTIRFSSCLPFATLEPSEVEAAQGKIECRPFVAGMWAVSCCQRGLTARILKGADNFDGDPAVGEIKKCHCATLAEKTSWAAIFVRGQAFVPELCLFTILKMLPASVADFVHMLL